VRTGGDGVPVSAGEALEMIDAALDFLNGPAREQLGVSALGGVLTRLSAIGAKYSAAWNYYLSKFDANDCHDADGYQTSAAWLAHKTQTKLSAARGQVRQMRLVTARPALDAAMAAGELSQSWAREIIAWTKELPPDMRGDLDGLLLRTVAAGADLEDLRMLVHRAIEQWKARQPDPDDPRDGFDDRSVTLDRTFGGAGRLRGDLSPECAAALQAVLDTLGKKQGGEDTRTQAQRFHDGLQEACELLIRAKMVPGRAGSDTRVDVVVPLGQLRELPGATALEDAWLAAGADTGHHAYLTGKAAEAISCDALIVPVVTGAADWSVIAEMIELVADAVTSHGTRPGDGGTDAGAGPASGLPAQPAGMALPPEAWEALLYAMAKLAIGFVSGPGGLASVLRTSLLDAPLNSRSVPIDVGWSEHIPEPVRRAVMLRDQKCRWPGGCDRKPAVCDVHHIKHKRDGGPTSVKDCILLCQYHHDICIHRWRWKLELLPDGEAKASGPRGQVLRSHGPPGTRPPGRMREL
jgi:uncharacterized protein DUF222